MPKCRKSVASFTPATSAISRVVAPRLPLRPITSRAAVRIRSRVSSGDADRPLSSGLARLDHGAPLPVPTGTFVSYIPYEASATARTCGISMVACWLDNTE